MGVVLIIIIPYTDEGTESHWEWLARAEAGSQVSGAWGAHRLFEEREVPGDPAQAPLFSPLQPWQGRTQRLPRPPLAAKGPSQDLKGEFLREVRTQGRPSRQGLASLLEPLQTQCGR